MSCGNHNCPFFEFQADGDQFSEAELQCVVNDALQAIYVPLNSEIFSNMHSRIVAHGFAQAFINKQLSHRLRHTGHITLFNKKTGFPMHHRIYDSSMPGGNNRKAGSTCL